MLFDDLGESARVLLRGRGSALGALLTVLAKEHANASSAELAELLSSVPRDHKNAVGLLLARVALEEAVAARSRELFNKFMFRFGAHLKTSVSAEGLTGAQRLCLASAAERVFDVLPSASANQRAEVSAIRQRLSRNHPAEADWKKTLGLSEPEFVATVDHLGREMRGGKAGRPKAKGAVGPARQKTRDLPAGYVHFQPPQWLASAFSTQPDPLVVATRNWVPEDVSGDGGANTIPNAWSAFKNAAFTSARDCLSELLGSAGEAWGPTSGADALRAWNWMRLVAELASLESGEALDTRRSWVSVCELLNRCLPEDEDLLSHALDKAIGDFVASDIASSRALSAYSGRLVAALGHELALGGYSNLEKASVRDGWAKFFKLENHEVRGTVNAAAAIKPKIEQTTRRLYLSARSNDAPAKILREEFHRADLFLDEGESLLFREALEVASDVDRAINSTELNHIDLIEGANSLRAVQNAISVSGSLLLQDTVGPLLAVCQRKVQIARSKLGDISRPELDISLASAKIPFSGAPGSSFEIRFIVTNNGNAAAEGISLRVLQAQLAIASEARLPLLGPGAQSEIAVTACSPGQSPRAVALTCELRWSDSLMQQFSSSHELSAEDQKPVSWSSGDLNPYSLNTISEPERLVGRAADLASLDALIAGGASAYITGHKRVGKTSLTKVLLRSIREQRGWAGSLMALGRALGEEQSAGDLVYALLDEILDAAREAYGTSLQHLDPVDDGSPGNFARVANRWLRSVERALPHGARVVVAIDDFDELPAHLVVGPQADALFLFLRSLVDEPWLNLIVVGSEILPSIIQAQAHKLNQVVPVSVTNFPTRASTAELLETPTRERLEWMPESIDRAHYLCGGNPYYETLLAQQLWQTLRDRSRSVVTSGDVNEAAEAVADKASESHFVHLWADGASGLDHTARPAIVASAVMRSVARCGGEQLTPAAGDEMTRIAQGWIQTATSDELLKASAGLTARGVLRAGPSANSLLIAIPLVGIWLLRAGGGALDGVYAASQHATAIARMITDADLVLLARQLRYRGEQVTEIRIRAWLEQFGDNYKQYLAFKMLKRMVQDGYFTSTRLQNTELPRLAKAVANTPAAQVLIREANNQNLRNGFLVEHGVAGDSTQGTLGLIAKSLRIKKAHIMRPDVLVEKIKGYQGEVVLFLLDDYCGSGSHLQGVFDRLVEEMSKYGTDLLDRATIVLGASVVATIDDLPTMSGDVRAQTVGGTFLGERYSPFSAGSGVFDSEQEMRDAEEMTSSIGRALVPNNPLGFGGRALLTLFEFNCPNNVAPIFWKNGKVSGENWLALFERST